MTRTALTVAALSLLAFASDSSAQNHCLAPQPAPINGQAWVCIGSPGGWLPPGHPDIPTSTTPTPTIPPGLTPTSAACTPRPNPYTEPERAAACTAWERQNLPQPTLPTYVVGRVYVDQYGLNKMVVLSVSLTLEGVPVVTVQHISGPYAAVGTVFAFRVLSGPAAWTLVD